MNNYTRTPKLPPDVIWRKKDDEFPHEYQDELGRPKLVVIREYAFHANGLPFLDPDTGKQVKRCPQRWWGTADHKKPPGARALLYKLPEVIQAIHAKKDIYIVEGEPKVTLLRNWGLAATCAPGGAENWTAEHSELLRGAPRIIILPDNDEVGKKHADKIGRTTEGVVHERCLLELPHLPAHGDVIDWQRNGGTKELFLEQPFLKWVPYYEEDTNPLGVWDAGDDVDKPPPRGWLYGNIFARKFFSSLLGDGGVGKTALRYAQLLSLAIGRSLTGDHVFQRCRVLIISLEDDADELRRRILALRMHYGISHKDVKGWLFLSAPGAKGGKLMTMDHRGRFVPGKLAAYLENEIIKRKIDIASIDPFVKTHSVEENNNSAIDDVAQILVDLSIKHNIAVDAPHHTSKGIAQPGNADRGRGASSMKDAGRLVYTLTPMSQEEANT